MLRSILAAFSLVVVGLSQAAEPAPDVASLERALAAVAAKIAPPEAEREALRQSLGNSLREEIRAANQRSTAEWRKLASADDWQRFAREKIAALRASLRLPPRAAKPQVMETGRIQGEGFTIRNLCYVSRPGLVVTANLYVPDPPRESMPGILLSHSHHNPKWEGELQDMGMTWARAGCCVLSPDHLGHGERRQHPFASAADYDKEFPVSRQDYHFRYDTSLQLYLVGESLMGWLVHDLMTGVDVLLAEPGIDPQRIAILGAVAGGGDPAAATAAVDERITCVVPFNFGGPQPETRLSAGDDPELAFNYAGGGSWESTRNLARSASDGFLPWVIVGSVAPRYLIHAHEFQWNGDRDPVWKRYQQIYQWHGQPDRLAVTHGFGTLTSKDPVGSHCNNIGPVHRKAIHEAFRKWFAIDVNPDAETKNRRTREELICLTPAAREKLQPQMLHANLAKQAKVKLELAHNEAVGSPARRAAIAKSWSATPPTDLTTNFAQTGTALLPFEEDSLLVWRKVTIDIGLTAENRLPGVRATVLLRKKPDNEESPLFIAIASDGAAGFLEHRRPEIADLLARGAAVALVDLPGIGTMSSGDDHGAGSAETSYAATGLMLGKPHLEMQLRHLRWALQALTMQTIIDKKRVYLWGDSFAQPLATDAPFNYPRRIDRPAEAEPAGPLLALLATLGNEQIAGVYTHGGLVSFASVLDSPFVQVPHACIVPGILEAGDLPDLVACLAPRPVVLEGLVDGRNRLVADDAAAKAYEIAASPTLVIRGERTGPISLLVKGGP
ncbi:MAG: hypothetical protein SFU86_04160 [Pirellulaceae bacterium]|nr:hypothetical protein [Pirellulaceae bacterium]